MPEDSFFIAGELTQGKFVRLTMEHIAVNFAKEGERGEAMTKTFLPFIGEVFRERFEHRGWRYACFVFFDLGLKQDVKMREEWLIRVR